MVRFLEIGAVAKRSSPRNSAPAGIRSRPVFLALAVTLPAAIGVAGFLLWPQADPPIPIPEKSLRPAATAPVYVPAEFGPQEALFLGGSQLAELHPAVMAGIVRAAAASIRVRILAGSPAERSRIESVLVDNNLLLSTVDIIDVPVMTMWVRDFGPVTVADAEGNRRLVDFHYRERRGNIIDDDVPVFLAREMGLDLVTSPLLLEGGDILTNGLGLCLLSTRVVNRNAHYRGLEIDRTVQDLAAVLGFDDLTMVRPLQGETTGHADMFCAFLRADLVVVGRYGPAVDAANAAGLDAIAADLAGRPTRAGPLRVERLPMPDHEDGIWRTYTNIVFANGVLLVPVYPDYCPDLDRIALATYRKLLPEHRVVGIDASRLIRMNGALRCITMNVPRGVALSQAGGTVAP